MFFKIFGLIKRVNNLFRRNFYSCLIPGACSLNVYGRFTVEYPERCRFSSDVTINEGVYINGRGGVIIGNAVRLSAGSKIITTGLNDDGSHVSSKVTIGDRVWVGAGAIILPDVVIADDCMIGAGAIVNRSCHRPGSLLVGVPAREVRRT